MSENREKNAENGKTGGRDHVTFVWVYERIAAKATIEMRVGQPPNRRTEINVTEEKTAFFPASTRGSETRRHCSASFQPKKRSTRRRRRILTPEIVFRHYGLQPVKLSCNKDVAVRKHKL